MRVHEGPTKNPIPRRQRNAQQKRRHNAPAGISCSGSKELLQTWSVFVYFWLKYGWNELRIGFPMVGKAIPRHNLHVVGEKIKLFFRFFPWKNSFWGKKGRTHSRPRVAGGGQAALVASLTLGDRFCYREPRTAFVLCLADHRIRKNLTLDFLFIG